MARIRSIHPGILTDEAFMTLTVECPAAIALMLGIWIEADDAGTFEWKPISIKAKCLPAAGGDIQALLAELERVGMIRRFEIEGKTYGVVRNFVKFQRPKDPKDIHPSSEEARLYAGFTSEGKRPEPTTGRKPFGSGSEVVRNDNGTTSGFSAQMKEVGGRRDLEHLDSEKQDGLLVAPTAPRKTKRAKSRSQIAADAQPDEADIGSATDAGLAPDQARREWAKFIDYHRSRGSVMADWRAAWRTWCRNAVEFMARNRSPPQTAPQRSIAFETSLPASKF